MSFPAAGFTEFISRRLGYVMDPDTLLADSKCGNIVDFIAGSLRLIVS